MNQVLCSGVLQREPAAVGRDEIARELDEIVMDECDQWNVLRMTSPSQSHCISTHRVSPWVARSGSECKSDSTPHDSIMPILDNLIPIGRAIEFGNESSKHHSSLVLTLVPGTGPGK